MEKRQSTSYMHLVVRHVLVTQTATCNPRVLAFPESVAASLKPRSALVKLVQARVFAKLSFCAAVGVGLPQATGTNTPTGGVGLRRQAYIES